MMAELLDAAWRALAVLAAFCVLPLLAGQAEHKVMGHMQGRVGPMEAGGFHGWAQLIADGVKFAQKQDTTPAAADRTVYRLAPAISLLPYLVALALLPWGPGMVAANPPASLLAVLAATAIGVIGTLMAGWSSGNRYSLLGGLRSAGQLVAYEVPLLLSAASVALAAGSLSLTAIVETWEWWWLFWQLPGAFVFLVAAFAELQRPPFDAPIADTELVMGPYTEYSGLRFALFLLAEYAGMVVMALLFTVLFLGGWSGPLPEYLGWLWTAMKASVVVFIFIWARVSWPRVREDQLQRLAWAGLVPVALAQLMLTALVVVMAL